MSRPIKRALRRARRPWQLTVHLPCVRLRGWAGGVQGWLGMRVLPLGRHSVMNGVALGVADASPDDVRAFGVRFEGLGLGWDRLYERGRVRRDGSRR